ncbi:MAG: tRNA pseudouridine(55) synthase TruB [Gammaproteobacteria bacterium]|nr:tRNA pseudouridine(55) synthase TruB [Gammaproteobacteria bacterium]
MGRRRHTKGRAIDGILLLDKPVGESSNQSLQRVKRLFGARKAGHTGSLDPLASGLLPICFGQATKMSAFLLEAGKRYQVRCQFGVSTDTGDAEGKVTGNDATTQIDEDRLCEVMRGFVGEIMQTPPMYSALRHKGERLYKLAREGIEVEREARPIKIYSLDLISLDGVFAEFDVKCSKGTYVRTLAEDIAAAMGTLAHVVGLRRTSVGPYGAEDMLTIDQLEALAGEGGFPALDQKLKAIDSAVFDRPEVTLNKDCAFYIRRGQPVSVAQAPVAGEVRLYGDNHGFLGVGEVLADGRVAPRRLFSA